MEAVLSNNRPRLYRALLISILVLFFLGGALTYLLSEEAMIRTIEALPVTCPLKRYTGFLCSLCGMTHAWVYFWHGDWAKAFTENKLSISLFTVFPFLMLSILTTKFWNEQRTRMGVIAGISLLVIYTIVRNL
jgi:hypothetical protein